MKSWSATSAWTRSMSMSSTARLINSGRQTAPSACRTAPAPDIWPSVTSTRECSSCSQKWPTRSSLIDMILKVTNTYLFSRSPLSVTAHPVPVHPIRLSCSPPQLTMEVSAVRSASPQMASTSLSPAGWAIRASPLSAVIPTGSSVLSVAACAAGSRPEISMSSKAMIPRIRSHTSLSPTRIRILSPRCDSIAELKSSHFWT